MEKQNLIISFSGGRTSAFMLWYILKHKQEFYNIIVIFANTGKEAEETLKFVNDCSINFNVKIIWIESYPITLKGWGVAANVKALAMLPLPDADLKYKS